MFSLHAFDLLFTAEPCAACYNLNYQRCQLTLIVHEGRTTVWKWGWGVGVGVKDLNSYLLSDLRPEKNNKQVQQYEQSREPIQGQKVLRTGKLMFICNHICDMWQHCWQFPLLCLSNLMSYVVFIKGLSLPGQKRGRQLWQRINYFCIFFFCCSAWSIHYSSQRHSINIARLVKNDLCFSQSKISGFFLTCDLTL